MFQDDRGNLLQIAEWLGRLKEGLAADSELANEVTWWRLSRINQCCDRLSDSYRAQHPEISALSLPTLDQVLDEPPPPVEVAAELARRVIDTFVPLLAALPPPPPIKAPQPKAGSRHDSIATKLRTLEPHLREQGICALYVFGSVARREDDPESDIDLTFEAASKAEGPLGSWDRSRIAEELARALGPKVDLVEWGSFRDDVRERVSHDMVRIFGQLRA